MNIFRFLPLAILAAFFISVPAHAQNDPMGAGSFSGGNGSDIESLANSEMMETSKDSSRDLKDEMRKVKELNERKKAQREAAKKTRNEKAKLKTVAVKPGVRPINANTSGNIIPPPRTIPTTTDSQGRSGRGPAVNEAGVEESMTEQSRKYNMINDASEKRHDTVNNSISNER
jgi:hypothetical protein